MHFSEENESLEEQLGDCKLQIEEKYEIGGGDWIIREEIEKGFGEAERSRGWKEINGLIKYEMKEKWAWVGWRGKTRVFPMEKIKENLIL